MKTFPISSLERAIIANRKRAYDRYVSEALKSDKIIGTNGLMTYIEWFNWREDLRTPNEAGRE